VVLLTPDPACLERYENRILVPVENSSRTGSDLAGIRTRAVRDGDHYVLNGTKTFITGGYLADLVIVVARTSDAPPGDRRAGLSLLVVEDGMPGFTKGRKLDKIGLKVQDTAELSFNDVRVPAANLRRQACGWRSPRLDSAPRPPQQESWAGH
jgi:alkylation response protein AidB-like acyl-CoA dehydrogenase